MPRRCRVCDRKLTSAVWRAVGLGPVCARRLGLRLQLPRPVLAPISPVRRVDSGDDQMALFDIPEGAA